MPPRRLSPAREEAEAEAEGDEESSGDAASSFPVHDSASSRKVSASADGDILMLIKRQVSQYRHLGTGRYSDVRAETEPRPFRAAEMEVTLRLSADSEEEELRRTTRGHLIGSDSQCEVEVGSKLPHSSTASPDRGQYNVLISLMHHAFLATRGGSLAL